METTIKVENLKCGGCINRIRKNLLQIKGVESVVVLPDEDEVWISYVDTLLCNVLKTN